MFTIIYYISTKYQYKKAKSQKKNIMYTLVYLGFINCHKKKLKFSCHKKH